MRRSDLFITTLLVVLDYLAVLAAFGAAYFFRDYLNAAFIMPLAQFIRLAAVFSLFWLTAFLGLGLYRVKTEHATLDEFLAIAVGSAAAVTISATLLYLFKQIEFSRLVLGGTFLFSLLFVYLERSLINSFQLFLYARGQAVRRILLIGAGRGAHLVLEGLMAERAKSHQVVGVMRLLDEKPEKLAGVRQLGKLEELDKVLVAHSVDEIILTSQRLAQAETDRLLRLCFERRIKLKFMPDLFSGPAARVASDTLAGMPLIEMQISSLSGSFVVIKRLMDTLVAVLALAVIAPLLAVAVLAIKLFDHPGPIIFSHERVGRFGKKFSLHKFRSMRMYRVGGKLVHAEEYLKVNQKLAKELEESPYYKIKDDPRVSWVGKFIRKFSIDELPQFINVLKGEMSVVGPRAYIERELNKQKKAYPQAKTLIDRLLLVKPGITGLWQVSGRSNIEFSERVAMDAYYATHADLWMDLRIILKTIPVVLKGSGAM